MAQRRDGVEALTLVGASWILAVGTLDLIPNGMLNLYTVYLAGGLTRVAVAVRARGKTARTRAPYAPAAASESPLPKRVGS